MQICRFQQKFSPLDDFCHYDLRTMIMNAAVGGRAGGERHAE